MQRSNYFEILPKELFLYILSFFSVEEILKIRGVARLFKMHADDPRMWQQNIINFFDKKSVPNDLSTCKSRFFQLYLPSSYLVLFSDDINYDPRAMIKKTDIDILASFTSNLRGSLEDTKNFINESKPFGIIYVIGLSVRKDEAFKLASSRMLRTCVMEVSRYDNNQLKDSQRLTFDEVKKEGLDNPERITKSQKT